MATTTYTDMQVMSNVADKLSEIMTEIMTLGAVASSMALKSDKMNDSMTDVVGENFLGAVNAVESALFLCERMRAMMAIEI